MKITKIAYTTDQNRKKDGLVKEANLNDASKLVREIASSQQQLLQGYDLASRGMVDQLFKMEMMLYDIPDDNVRNKVMQAFFSLSESTVNVYRTISESVQNNIKYIRNNVSEVQNTQRQYEEQQGAQQQGAQQQGAQQQGAQQQGAQQQGF